MAFVLPVSLERRFDVGRAYGSAGSFSRGVLFSSGAYENPVAERLAVAAALTYAYATDDEALGAELGLGRGRNDLSGTASYAIAPALAVFGSLGRTVHRVRRAGLPRHRAVGDSAMPLNPSRRSAAGRDEQRGSWRILDEQPR
jgi:hypothetical protein